MSIATILAEPLTAANRTKNGTLLVLLGVLMLVIFIALAAPAIKKCKEAPLLKQGAAMGRVLVMGPGGVLLIVAGVIVLLGGFGSS